MLVDRAISVVRVGVLVAALVVASTASAASLDRLAAVVNDEPIALSEVYDLGGEYIDQTCAGVAGESCLRDTELEVLDSLILRTLVHQDLIKLGLDVTGAEVDRTIDQMGQDYGLTDRAAFRKEVERSGMSWETYRDQLTEQLRRLKFNENVIRPRISMSEDELRDLYNRTARGVDGPQQRDLGAISLAPSEDVPAEELEDFARQLAEQINAGEVDWDEAVATYHTGVLGGPDGVMGSFAQGQLAPRLDEVVFAAPIGEVTPPLTLPGNTVVILRVVGETAASVRSFEEAADDLRNSLYESKIEEETERWYQQARRRSAVRILLETL